MTMVPGSAFPGLSFSVMQFTKKILRSDRVCGGRYQSKWMPALLLVHERGRAKTGDQGLKGKTGRLFPVGIRGER
ncbi:hypothetical protein EFB08_16545 [Rufibacter latericius]|uniref:Uncharacterized protein n=1 Tax=Rufibacter latericius TaxID=2487040 RepID=A0A3M9MI68_9BACT|nr:hypothetical protein EFB08_16545 [Rufibacter latericius]